MGSLSNNGGDGNENGIKAINLDWQNNNFVRSLRSKRFRASSSRTLGQEQKKRGITGEGVGERRFPLLPSPSPFHFFCSHSNSRAISRLEKLATQATLGVHYAFFLYISLQSLHDCDVKLFNFTFLENVNTRQRLSSSFPELRLWSPFSIRKVWQHLTNWARHNKHDEAWSSAYSLFKWRFRNRRRPCCLSSLTVSSDVSPQGNILLPELVTAAVSQSFLITTYKVDTSLTIWKKD